MKALRTSSPDLIGSLAVLEGLVRLCARDRKSQLVQMNQLRYSLAW